EPERREAAHDDGQHDRLAHLERSQRREEREHHDHAEHEQPEGLTQRFAHVVMIAHLRISRKSTSSATAAPTSGSARLSTAPPAASPRSSTSSAWRGGGVVAVGVPDEASGTFVSASAV